MNMITVSEDALNSIKEMAQRLQEENDSYKAAMNQALPLLSAHYKSSTEGALTISLFRHLLK